MKKEQKLCKEWFQNLQNTICKTITSIEKDFGSSSKFKRNKWKRGEFRIIEGKVIEKGGVAFSNVIGKFPKDFAKQIPGTEKNRNFWSSGVSVVLHPKNPKVPAMHFNTRFICTQESWFGGGIDATQSLKDLNQKKYFHNELKKMCNKHNKKYYPKYKKWCDEYFYLPHRNEARGIGGIFFDYLNSEKTRAERSNAVVFFNKEQERLAIENGFQKDFDFVKDVGITFDCLLKEMIRKNMFSKWTAKEKEIQLMKRGRYVEYNLLYDRGTKFGLNSGGNPKAILMSMPPQAKWK